MVTTPEPAGFPKCGTCPLLESGTATICFECANATLPHEHPPTCPVCGLHQSGAKCANPICSFDDRGYGSMHVIAMHQGAIRDAISRFKHGFGDPKRYATGWASIFGRLVVGYLEAHDQELAGSYDLIVPNPTFPEHGEPQHTEMTIDAARSEIWWWDWPFDAAPWALVKTYATPSSTGGTWREKFDRAQLHAAAITVDRSRIEGKRILIYDDVFTTGSQYHWVGRKLYDNGAAHVDGLVLARRPWGG